jgi:hypothetical protein
LAIPEAHEPVVERSARSIKGGSIGHQLWIKARGTTFAAIDESFRSGERREHEEVTQKKKEDR